MWESRVLGKAFERLELHEWKHSRAVLSTTPLDLLDGIACMDDVRFCKRLVFKALREVA
jgi:hypothetical protein